MKNIDNIELQHDHEDCYRIIIKSIDPDTRPSWSVRGQMGNYISIHPPGGPWIGVGGKLDCFGIKDRIVESIYVKDEKAFLRTKVMSNITEEQLLEQLIQNPEKLRDRISNLNKQIELMEAEWVTLSRRKAVYEQLLLVVDPTPKKAESKSKKGGKKVAMRKVAVKAKRTPFKNLRARVMAILEQAQNSMTGRELGEVLKEVYNVTDNKVFGQLVNSINMTLSDIVISSGKLRRTKERSNHYEYSVIRNAS